MKTVLLFYPREENVPNVAQVQHISRQAVERMGPMHLALARPMAQATDKICRGERPFARWFGLQSLSFRQGRGNSDPRAGCRHRIDCMMDAGGATIAPAIYHLCYKTSQGAACSLTSIGIVGKFRRDLLATWQVLALPTGFAENPFAHTDMANAKPVA